jgi:hypothetical protein
MLGQIHFRRIAEDDLPIVLRGYREHRASATSHCRNILRSSRTSAPTHNVAA